MHLSIQERCTKVIQDYKYWVNGKKTKIDDGLNGKIKSFRVKSSSRTLTIDCIKRGVWSNINYEKLQVILQLILQLILSLII